MPAQNFASVVIDDEGLGGSADTPGPDLAQVRRSALVRSSGDSKNDLHAGPHADWELEDLTALNLEASLHRILVEAQKPGQRATSQTRAPSL